MMDCLHRFFVSPCGYVQRIVLSLLAIAAVANTSTAQITTQMLIGDAVSEVTGSRYSDVDEAIKRFANRDVLGARQFLEAARLKDKTLPPTDLTLAKMYFLANNAAGGRASLEKTAQDNPGDPEAYLILADQAIRERRIIEAESLYDKGLQLAEKFSENAQPKTKPGNSRTYGPRSGCRAAAKLAGRRRRPPGAPENRSGQCRGTLSVGCRAVHAEEVSRKVTTSFKTPASSTRTKRFQIRSLPPR